MDKLIIPDKIVVGFQHREDTYSKKLGFITYREKGKLKKGKTWTGWVEGGQPQKTFMGYSKEKEGTEDYSKPQYRNREGYINEEYDNVPTTGFVLNKDVGGVRHSYSHNARMEKVRVFDPRGFEIEIDIPNLLFILQECTSVKGKGLDGDMIYGWDGQSLKLIPTSCEEYQKSIEHTKIQDYKMEDPLIEGAVYKSKQGEELIYLGEYGLLTGYSMVYSKKHFFYPAKEKEFHGYKLVDKKDTSFLASIVQDTPHENYPALVESLSKEEGFNGKFASHSTISFPAPQKTSSSYERYMHKYDIIGGSYYGESKEKKDIEITMSPLCLKVNDNIYYRLTVVRLIKLKPTVGDRYPRYDWSVVGYKIKATSIYDLTGNIFKTRSLLKEDKKIAPDPERIFTHDELRSLNIFIGMDIKL